MKIAIIVRRLNVRGGTQRAAICLARELKAQGHTVALYTFFYSKEDCYAELLDDMEVIVADSALAAAMGQSSRKRGALAFIRSTIDQNRAARDLTHKIAADTDLLNPHDQLAYRVSRYFKREIRSVPSVWVMNDISTKKSTLLREAQFDETVHASLPKRIAYWLMDSYDYWQFIRCQDIIAVLDTRDKQWAQEQFHGKKTVVVRNGLDIREFPYTERAGIFGRKIHLLCVAILLPHRRFEDAIEAVGLLRAKGIDATLSIIGDKGDKKYYDVLQALVVARGLGDSVEFLGRVSYESLLDAYRTADAFVFPCHLQSWGLAVFEAMATGLPAIVSKTSGASEVLHDGTNALIVPPYSPEGIAHAAERLLEPALYQKISAEGRRFVEENISWKRYADSLMGLFREAQKPYSL